MTIQKIITTEETSSRYGHSAVKNNDKKAHFHYSVRIDTFWWM